MSEFAVGDKVFTLDQLTPGTVMNAFASSAPDIIDMFDVQFENGFRQSFHIARLSKSGPGAMTRKKILDKALDIVTRDRNKAYGEPEDNFKDIAKFWTTYKGVEFHAHDVAQMMILVKASRIKTSPEVEDHWVDQAGYSACGGQAFSATEGL